MTTMSIVRRICPMCEVAAFFWRIDRSESTYKHIKSSTRTVLRLLPDRAVNVFSVACHTIIHLYLLSLYETNMARPKDNAAESYGRTTDYPRASFKSLMVHSAWRRRLRRSTNYFSLVVGAQKAEEEDGDLINQQIIPFI